MRSLEFFSLGTEFLFSFILDLVSLCGHTRLWLC